ncbi:MAG: radical SAM protein, partial [Pseudomonadota bacterium]
APACNIKCNYCDRKYSCANKSRVGVTSAVLAPHQAQEYFYRVLEAEPCISVAGIAGPGEPMANAAKTLQTIHPIKRRFPGILLCLSSNGLTVPEHQDALADAGVTHVAITVNAVYPAIEANIYSWVKDGKVAYRGEEAARLLLERQAQAVAGLKQRGITVKLNSIVIPTVNDQHMSEVARWGAELGADLMYLMPMHPTQGTPFETLGEPKGGGAALRGRGQPGRHPGQPAPGPGRRFPDLGLHPWRLQPAGDAPRPRGGRRRAALEKAGQIPGRLPQRAGQRHRRDPSGGFGRLRRGAPGGERLHRGDAQGHLRGRRPPGLAHSQG